MNKASTLENMVRAPVSRLINVDMMYFDLCVCALILALFKATLHQNREKVS